MALYAIGDVQGCLDPLKKLLDHINFDPAQDRLWLAGDLVNRGPNSAGTLAFVRSLGSSSQTVLGNHDLHLLAVAQGKKPVKNDDINRTLDTPNIADHLEWLVSQPLLLRDKSLKVMMTHAGIPPCWSDREARSRAEELETVLRDVKKRASFFSAMYGSEPSTWQGSLTGAGRLRYIVNAFTRMRFCGPNGELEFKFNGAAELAPPGKKPWFAWPVQRKHQLLFGHWAALMGNTQRSDVVGLDTGFVWGNYLTCFQVETGTRFMCDQSLTISVRHHHN